MNIDLGSLLASFKPKKKIIIRKASMNFKSKLLFQVKASRQQNRMFLGQPTRRLFSIDGLFWYSIDSRLIYLTSWQIDLYALHSLFAPTNLALVNFC
jgi:hypothetical protein